MSWCEFKNRSPDLASLGASLLDRKIAYLATTRQDGSPRIHPVRPIIGRGHCFIFIDRRSPKRRDLLRDGRYAIHCAVFESNGLSPEFMISGIAAEVSNLKIRNLACEIWGQEVPTRYALFDFSVTMALATEYTEQRQPVRSRWKLDE